MKLTENIEFYKKISNESRESNRNNVNKKVNELKLQRFLVEKTASRSTKSRSKNVSTIDKTTPENNLVTMDIRSFSYNRHS